MSDPQEPSDFPEPPAGPTTTAAHRQDRWAWLISGLAVLSTLIPYLIGAGMADGRRFMWLGYNLDDSCQYLSWMRQSADGAYRALNLFTTDPQNGMALNPLFLVLGRIAAWTHLPLITVYHGSRLALGLVLLRLVWNFITLTVANGRARIAALLFVCFSAGLGWLPAWWGDPPFNTPIDKWQPEAITYLSLYLSPLFCFAMALQVGIVTLLFVGFRTGKMRYAVGAGFGGLVLGLVHTYDVASLAAVWIVYLLLSTVLPKQQGQARLGAAWLQALVAGAITAPSLVYIYHELTSEAVFRARAAVQTLAPPPTWIFLGYGLTALLAVGAALLLLMQKRTADTDPPPTPAADWTTGRDAVRLLLVWALVNVAVCYLPTAIQRKFLQGAHFPIATLAGIGAAWLLQRFKPNAKPWQVAFKLAIVTFLLSLTNILFVLRDISNYQDNLSQTKQQRTYLQNGEIEALEWVRDHSNPSDALQPLPWIVQAGPHSYRVYEESLACFAPSLIDRRVYCGHWGETPDFQAKLKELGAFEFSRTTDAARRDLLRKMKVRFLVFSQKRARDESLAKASTSDATIFAESALGVFRGNMTLPPYLTLVHSNDDADVYEVQPNL